MGTIYTVERCRRAAGYPRHYGYVIRRSPPTIQTFDDVEGVGWCRITPIEHHFDGWYRYRRGAEKWLAVLHEAQRAGRID